MHARVTAEDNPPPDRSGRAKRAPRVPGWPVPTRLAEADPEAYDEWRGQPAGSPTPATGPQPEALTEHWQQFLDGLGPQGWADLGARLQHVRSRVQEDGVSYNVYADLAGQGAAQARPWPLELLPTIVGADDWAQIERGVLQRARLMQATMADIYGPQELLRDALLPASLVHAHPQYLRAVRGLQPPGGQWLHIVAFDITRAPEGGFQVLVQRSQTPSGLGYLLQNRLIVPPQFQDQFQALHVQRLAASFRTLVDGLMQVSPAGTRSRVVLLTPGPLNETYFEQVFLARYLGLTLVEGSDLTVRGQQLFLKTLRGLERVHVVLRRVDDEFLDPLELRADSALGVPGLLQALRAGQVVVANAPGVGVLESPGLSAFWPGVARRLLDEELELPASTSWWCGEHAVWQVQRERLADFVVAPTFQNAGFGPQHLAGLDEAALDRWRARIDADPAAYTLQAPVRPGQTPVWIDGRLHARAAVLRVFAVADGSGGWRVLPGAFTRVAGEGPAAPADLDERGTPPAPAPSPAPGKARASTGTGPQSDPWLSMQHGSASVDTWVITRDEVDTSSLLPRPLTTADLQDGWSRSVSSRAAENLFWLGRYTERAEHMVRLLRLTLDGWPGATAPARGLVGQLALWHGLVLPGTPAPTVSVGAARLFERALVQGLRADGPQPGNSLPQVLQSLRRCAMALRERLSPEQWRVIQELEQRFAQQLNAALRHHSGAAAVPDVLAVLAQAATHLAAITGAQTDRMTRDDGWRLLSVGRQIERVDNLGLALSRAIARRVHEADDGFDLVLGLFDSVITYRAQFQGRRELLPLLHLLVADTDNPRSLAWVTRTMRDRLRKLVGPGAPWVVQVTDELPRPDEWDLGELALLGKDAAKSPLVQSLDGLVDAARGLSEQISRHLFTHVASPDRRVWQ